MVNPAKISSSRSPLSLTGGWPSFHALFNRRKARSASYQPLEAVAERELERSRSIQLVDRFKLLETRVGRQIADLIQGCPVTTGRTACVVLVLEYSRTILDVKVCVIKQVESLHFNLNHLPVGDVERARDAQINFVDPGSIKRVETKCGTGASAGDSSCGVAGRFVNRAIVERIAGAAEKPCVGSAGIELHDGADGPVREQVTFHRIYEMGGIRRVDCGHREPVALVEKRRRVGVPEIKLVEEIHTG